MIKRIFLFSSILSMAVSFTSFAGSWKQDNVGWWYLNDDSTYPKSTWQKIDQQWYYFDESGYIVTEQWVGDYYLNSNGTLATNQWIGNYYVDANGKWSRIALNTDASTQNNEASSQNHTNSTSSKSKSVSGTISSSPYDGYKFIVNTNTMKYHYPNCSAASKIKEKNIGYSQDESELQALGYTPCHICH